VNTTQDKQLRRQATRWLVALAMAGIGARVLVLLVPFLLFAWIGFSHGMGILVIAAAIAAGIVWVIAASEVTAGVRITRDQAPELHAEVQAWADAIRTRRVSEIRLTDGFDVQAVAARMRWQPWRHRTVLFLGTMTLLLVGRDTVRTLIVHELGKVSRPFGRIQQWLGTPAVKRHQVTQRVGRWFGRQFARLSPRHARLSVHACDEFAAEHVGALTVGTALLAQDLVTERWRSQQSVGMDALIARSPQPPASWMGWTRERLLQHAPSEEEIARRLRHASAPQDTMPSLRERLDWIYVLGRQAQAGLHLASPSAGEAWLTDWKAITAHHDAKWLAAHDTWWRQKHVMLRHLSAELDALRQADDRSLRRAELELREGNTPFASEISQAWIGHAAHDLHARFLFGASQVRRYETAGIATLEACVKEGPAWAVAARMLLLAYEDLLESDAARERNRKLLERAELRQARVRGKALHLLQLGRVEAPELPADRVQVLREVYRQSPAVAGAWCMQANKLEDHGRQYRVVMLVLRLRTEVLRESGSTEEQFRRQAHELMTSLLPGCDVAMAWTLLTTEAISPDLDELITRWSTDELHPGCIVKAIAGESVGPGTRPLAHR